MFGLLVVSERGPRVNMGGRYRASSLYPHGCVHLRHWLSNKPAAARDLATWRRDEKRRQRTRCR